MILIKDKFNNGRGSVLLLKRGLIMLDDRLNKHYRDSIDSAYEENQRLFREREEKRRSEEVRRRRRDGIMSACKILMLIIGTALFIGLLWALYVEDRQLEQRIEKINFKNPSNEDLAFLEICRLRNERRFRHHIVIRSL